MNVSRWIAVLLAFALLVGSASTAYADGGKHSKSKSKSHDGDRGKVTSHEKSDSHGRSDSQGKKDGDRKITICHRTGSATNPYVEITIDKNGMNGHGGHDDIVPAPAGGCPDGEVASAKIKDDDKRHDTKVKDHDHKNVVRHDFDVTHKVVTHNHTIDIQRDIHLRISVNDESISLHDINRDLDISKHLKVLLLVNGQMISNSAAQDMVADLGSLDLTLVVNGTVIPTGNLATGTDASGNLVIVVPSSVVVPAAATDLTTASMVILPNTTTQVVPASPDVLASVLQPEIIPATTPALPSEQVIPDQQLTPDQQSATVQPAPAGNAGLAGFRDGEVLAAALASLVLLLAVGGARWMTAIKR